MQYCGMAVTDIGIVKKVNQDSLTCKIANSVWGMVGLAVMCDGLGGLKQGEVASASVIKAFAQWFHDVFPDEEDGWDAEKLRSDWEDIVFDTNLRLIEYGKNNGTKLGTTVTAVLFYEDSYYVIHVGDCRLYEISNTCVQLTKDQTVVSQEIEAGRMTLEQAATDSRRNVLLQCVGVNDNLKPSFFTGMVKPETTYLLCSDGFRHEISEQEIYQYCNPQKNIKQSVMEQNLNYLITLDKNRGERDNISAILIRADR